MNKNKSKAYNVHIMPEYAEEIRSFMARCKKEGQIGSVVVSRMLVEAIRKQSFFLANK